MPWLEANAAAHGIREVAAMGAAASAEAAGRTSPGHSGSTHGDLLGFGDIGVTG